MAGFSRQEQLFLAALVRFQRRDIPTEYATRLPERIRKALGITLICIRLSWIFCRTREDEAIPPVDITLTADRISLILSTGWKENHPLTIADLEYEKQALEAIAYQLDIVYTNHEFS